MTPRILAPAAERLQIHLAVCRARRAALLCGTCAELAERAAASAAQISSSGRHRYAVAQPVKVAA